MSKLSGHGDQHPSQVPPAAQVGGGKPKHRDTGKNTGGSMAPATSQFRRTAGDNRRSWGRRHINEKRVERRQEAERDMHARAKWQKTWSSGGGISGGGERGRDHRHQWTNVTNSKYRPESSVRVAAVRGLEQHHLIMSTLSGHGYRT